MSSSNSYNNLVSYTNRDYISIYNDLVSAISSLTNLWTNRDESDPGIVLIKLMSMLGDNLSYNIDKMALEVYPDTVQQRKNAFRVFNLLGYKMHWYRSATTEATINLSGGSSDNILSIFSQFSTLDNKINYTLTNEVDIIGSDGYATVQLVEGTMSTPSATVPTDSNTEWFDYYSYNIGTNNITSDNKIYLGNTNVDETNIILIDNARDTWTLVNNLALITDAGKYFEFDIDDYDNPYIKLVDYWNTSFSVNQFKLFYLISSGSNGTIASNTLRLRTGLDSGASTTISNLASVGGYDPETPEEARINSSNYSNTFNTLITLSDYEKAISRISGVANVLTTDKTTDPGIMDSSSGQYTPIDTYVVKAYVIPTSSYESSDEGGTTDNADSSVLGSLIIDDISSYTLSCQNVVIDTSSTIEIPWTPSGTIWLTEPVNQATANNILTSINNMLLLVYNASNINFNSKLDYLEIINTIMESDSRIAYVDLDPISYINPYSLKDSNNNYIIQNIPSIRRRMSGDQILTGVSSFEINDTPVPATVADSSSYTTYSGMLIDSSLYQSSDISPFLIRPNNIFIQVFNSTYTIFDDGQGNLSNYDGILYESGSINYQTGAYNFTLSNTYFDSSDKPKVNLIYNRISIPSYKSFTYDNSSLLISSDSIDNSIT